MNRSAKCLALGLGCLLSLAVVSRAWADGATPAAKDPDDPGRPAPLRVPGAVTNEPPISERLVIPPYIRDRRGDVTTTALFPLYYERKTAKDFERLVVPYYYRRGPKLNADVALGLVWSLRGPNRNTFILPPLYTHRDGKDWAFGLPPLFATGVFKGHHHTVIPALLTWIDGDAKTHHKIVGPYFDWKNDHATWWGVFPFLWNKSDEVDRFTLVPPLFFRFTDDDPKRDTLVVPPFYRHTAEKEKSWGLVPLVFRKETPELKSTTVPLAIFHHAKGPEEFRLVVPGFAYFDSKKNGRLWVSPVYQRRRGDKNLNAVAPLFFQTWDDRDKSSGLVVPPIYWHWEDPANDTTVVLPLFGRWYREGISSSWVIPLLGRYKSFERDEQTWWVAPTFHYAWTETSWQFNIHPLFYRKESPEKSHFALAPLWFDFRNHENKTHRFVLFPLYWNFKNFAKKTRSTIGFPLYWDFENGRKQTRRIAGFPLYWDFNNRKLQKRTTAAFPLYFRAERGKRVRHFALNTFFETKEDVAGKHWQFHFFPLTSFGRDQPASAEATGATGANDAQGKPQAQPADVPSADLPETQQKPDKWWSVLYGLAGYERRGTHRRIRVFWIPFELK